MALLAAVREFAATKQPYAFDGEVAALMFFMGWASKSKSFTPRLLHTNRTVFCEVRFATRGMFVCISKGVKKLFSPRP